MSGWWPCSSARYATRLVKSSASRKFLKRNSFSRWVLLHHTPVVAQSGQQVVELRSPEGRRPTPARNALEAWPGHSFGSIVRRARAWAQGRQAGCAVLAPLVAGDSSLFACDGLLRLHVATLPLPNAIWHRSSVRDTDSGTTGARRYRAENRLASRFCSPACDSIGDQRCHDSTRGEPRPPTLSF